MRRGWTAAEVAKLLDWRHAGAKVVVIALRLGRTRHSVQRKLHALRVVVRPNRGRWAGRGRELARRVAARLRAGEPVTAVAESLGVDHAVVSVIRKRLGIAPATERAKRLLAWEWRRKLGA